MPIVSCISLIKTKKINLITDIKILISMPTGISIPTHFKELQPYILLRLRKFG